MGLISNNFVYLQYKFLHLIYSFLFPFKFNGVKYVFPGFILSTLSEISLLRLTTLRLEAVIVCVVADYGCRMTQYT